MNNNFLNFLAHQTKDKKNSIAVLPFFDNAVGQPDRALFYGIPFLVYDIYSASHDNMIHPFVSFNFINNENMTGQILAQKETAQKLAQKLSASYVVFGTYQRTYRGTIRVIINIYDSKKDQMLSPAEELDANADDAFIDLVKNHLAIALKRAGVTSTINKTYISSPSMQAFVLFGKGLEFSMQYDLTALDLASLWFENALKESYQRYDNAALHLARVNFMMALINKLNKDDFSINWRSATAAMGLVSPATKRSSIKYLAAGRFLESYKLAMKAETASMTGNTKMTGTLAYEALKLVPEDGLLQNLYLTTAAKRDGEIMINNPICF
ncbi:MAG: hypothetical protein HQM16_02070 [Deltaproteobacteria bacterium]|nr:hypothetical protein [Deltaproteobacteria bacterium]